MRVPVGKLHNDRYVPLHPNAARLLTDWTTTYPAVGGRLLRHADGRLLDRYHVGRVVARVWPAKPASGTSTPTSCATP